MSNPAGSVGVVQGSEPSAAAAAHDFWDSVLSPTDSSPVRAPRSQRLRPAPSIEGAFVWNAGLSLQDPITTKAIRDMFRTSEDLLGTTITREAIRQTPRARQSLVLRPGFREKAVAAEEKQHQLLVEDDRAAIRRRGDRAGARTAPAACAHASPPYDPDASLHVADARIQACRDAMRRRREEHAAAAVLPPTVREQQHPFHGVGSPRRVAVATDGMDDEAGSATLAALATFETKMMKRRGVAAAAAEGE